MSIPICRVNVYDDFYDPQISQNGKTQKPQYRIKGDYEYCATTVGLFSEDSLGLSSAKINFGGSFIDVSLEIPLPNHMIVEAQHSEGALYDLLRYDNYWSIEYGWGDKEDKSTFSMHNMMIRDFSLDYDTSNRFFNLKIDLAPRLIQILRNINLIHCVDMVQAIMGHYKEDSRWVRWNPFIEGENNKPNNGPSVADIIWASLQGAKDYIKIAKGVVGKDYLSGATSSQSDGRRQMDVYRVWTWPKEIKLRRNSWPDWGVQQRVGDAGVTIPFYFEKIESGKSEFLGNYKVDQDRLIDFIKNDLGIKEVHAADNKNDMIPIEEYIDIKKIGTSTQLNASLVTANEDKEIPDISDFQFTFVGNKDNTIKHQKNELTTKRVKEWDKVRDNLQDYDYIAGTSVYAFLDEILKNNGYILCFTPGLYESGKQSVKQLVIPANVDPSVSTDEKEFTLSASVENNVVKYSWNPVNEENQSLYFGGKQLVEFGDGESEEVDYFNLHSMTNVILSVSLDATGGKKTIATVRSEEALVAGVDNNQENKNPPAKDIEIYDFLTKLAKSITMKTIGIPHIRPWDVVNFTALGDLFTGKYRVITASHSISNGSYETELELMETVMPKNEILVPNSPLKRETDYDYSDLQAYLRDLADAERDIMAAAKLREMTDPNRQARTEDDYYVKFRGGGRY